MSFLQRHRTKLMGLGILVGAVSIVMVLGLLKPEPEKEETAKPALMVKTIPAEYREQQVYATFQGEVRAKTNIDLVTQVSGKVNEVSEKFIEGGFFEPGEVLLQIDDSDYQVALRSAEAAVASAHVDLDLELATAETNARQWRELQQRPLSEASPLLLNEPQINRAKARLNAAKAELAAAKLNYDRTKISAPFAGRIQEKKAELGQFMTMGSSIGRVFATDAMEVRIPMTDIQLAELGLAMGYSASRTNSIGLPARISSTFGDEILNWTGHVRSVDASVDSQTRLLYATVVVDEPYAINATEQIPLAPGLFVDVELASPEKLKGLEIPRTALRNGNQVYVYENDELILRPVKVIFTSEDMVMVANGSASKLQPGESVITSPVPGAYQGMPIKLPTQSVENIAASPDSLSPDKANSVGDEASTEDKPNTDSNKASTTPSDDENTDEAAESAGEQQAAEPQSSSGSAVSAAAVQG